MRWSTFIALALFLTCLRGQDYRNGDFDIDNRAALVQVLRNSVKGKWQTHSNKTLPFDEFKQGPDCNTCFTRRMPSRVGTANGTTTAL